MGADNIGTCNPHKPQGVLDTSSSAPADQINGPSTNKEDGQQASALARHAVVLHNSAARRLGAVARHFLALVDQYVSIMVKKRRQLLEQQAFLQVRCFLCASCCSAHTCVYILMGGPMQFDSS